MSCGVPLKDLCHFYTCIPLSHPSVHNRYIWTVGGVQCNMSSKRLSCSCSSFISQSPRWTVRYIPWSPPLQASVASVCPFKKCMDSKGHHMEFPLQATFSAVLSHGVPHYKPYCKLYIPIHKRLWTVRHIPLSSFCPSCPPHLSVLNGCFNNNKPPVESSLQAMCETI